MNSPENTPDIARLIALKRYEQPPPGFADYLRGRIMREIASEQHRAAQPWWERMLGGVTWQRGMVAANALAFAGVAFLAAATFQVAQSVANEEIEVQVYAALPLPPEALNRMAANSANTAVVENRPTRYLRPLPSHGGAVLATAFTLTEEPVAAVSPSTNEAPRWLFETPSSGNPRFILARDRR